MGKTVLNLLFLAVFFGVTIEVAVRYGRWQAWVALACLATFSTLVGVCAALREE